LKILDGLIRRGTNELRTVRVELCRRRRVASEPLARLWLPKMEWVGSDLFVDRIQGRIHLGGAGPFSLVRRRVLQRLLDAILASPDFAIRADDLFTRVWGGTYDPLAHEGRIHVNVHRLRCWFGENSRGGEALLEVRDGVVQLAADAEVCILDLHGEDAESAKDTPASERVLQCLPRSQPLSPGELQQRLGVSRSQINRTLRVLLAEGHIVRSGAGRSTRYSRVGGTKK